MFPAGTLTQLLNDGLKKMATDFDWPWLQTVTSLSTTAGEETYSPPSDWTRTLWIADHTQLLKLRARQDLVRYLGFNGTGSSGKPLFYSITGESIVLAPTPNEAATLQHAYVKAENVLSADGDTALCPLHYDELIILYAQQEAAVLLKDRLMYEMAGAEIEKWKMRLKDNIRRSAGTSRPIARTDWYI